MSGLRNYSSEIGGLVEQSVLVKIARGSEDASKG